MARPFAFDHRVDIDRVLTFRRACGDVVAGAGSRGNGHIARAVAAWVARSVTSATLRELATPLGWGRPESVSNLTRRIAGTLNTNSELAKDI